MKEPQQQQQREIRRVTSLSSRRRWRRRKAIWIGLLVVVHVLTLVFVGRQFASSSSSSSLQDPTNNEDAAMMLSVFTMELSKPTTNTTNTLISTGTTQSPATAAEDEGNYSKITNEKKLATTKTPPPLPPIATTTTISNSMRISMPLNRHVDENSKNDKEEKESNTLNEKTKHFQSTTSSHEIFSHTIEEDDMEQGVKNQEVDFKKEDMKTKAKEKEMDEKDSQVIEEEEEEEEDDFEEEEDGSNDFGKSSIKSKKEATMDEDDVEKDEELMHEEVDFEDDDDEDVFSEDDEQDTVSTTMIRTNRMEIMKDYTTNRQLHRPFPRWGGGSDLKHQDGIPIDDLFDFLQATIHDPTVSTITTRSRRRLYSELFYFINGRGVYTSYKLKRRTQKSYLHTRVRPNTFLFQLAKQMLQATNGLRNSQNLRNDQLPWKRLRQVLVKGGFPFFAFVGDYRGCAQNNVHIKKKNRTISLPLFTVAADIYCNHSFPMPTYKTIRDSYNTTKEWDGVMNQWKERYPLFHQKIPKVVWRGALSGSLERFTSPRWRLPYYIHNQVVGAQKDLFNVGIYKVPARHHGKEINITQVGGLVKPIVPMEHFQKYQAIIDIDGNSWSSRFGKLLCYNSVILKVNARYVDYFYYAQNHRLEPWVHYIPVQYDLSDLVQQATFALDPANRKNVTRIIHNANAWCRKRMTRPAIAKDFLDIWEKYVLLLDKGDPDWQTKWRTMKGKLRKEKKLYRIIKQQ